MKIKYQGVEVFKLFTGEEMIVEKVKLRYFAE